LPLATIHTDTHAFQTDQIQGHSAQKRTEALKFLIHLIGDAHQPLHTENISRGGNDIFICFFDKCGSDSRPMELHAIWDAEIPDMHRGVADSSKFAVLKKAGKKWADELASSTMVQDLLTNVDEECLDIGKAQECSLVWAGDANAKVCEFVLKDFPFQQKCLGDNYFEGAVPVVDEMIAKAGFRLGKWINALAEVGGRGEAVGLVGQSGDGEL
jgi:hypothetical protein